MSYLMPSNRYTTVGFLVLVVGFFLVPIGIGILVMPIGAVMMAFGVHLSIYRMIPGYKKITQTIIDSYKPYFKKWKKQ